jgi:hypothetical protein
MCTIVKQSQLVHFGFKRIKNLPKYPLYCIAACPDLALCKKGGGSKVNIISIELTDDLSSKFGERLLEKQG